MNVDTTPTQPSTEPSSEPSAGTKSETSAAPHSGAGARQASTSRIGFWVLIGILAVTGVAMAIIVAFGLTESKAFGLVGYLFLADFYLVVSLVARHKGLQRTIWVGTVLTFVLGVVLVFWPESDYYVNANDPNAGPDEWIRTPYGLWHDIAFASHTVLGTLLALGLISLAYKSIVGERTIRAIYFFMFGTGLIAAALWAGGLLWEDSDGLLPYQLSVTILALTAAAIVIIAAFVQRNAQLAEERRSVAEIAHGAHGMVGAGGGLENEEALRALVRQYVDEYLAERER